MIVVTIHKHKVVLSPFEVSSYIHVKVEQVLSRAVGSLTTICPESTGSQRAIHYSIIPMLLMLLRFWETFWRSIMHLL